MTASCNWSSCSATENLHLYAGGKRCPDHTPAALKGVPEPHELAERVHAAKAASEGARPATGTRGPCCDWSDCGATEELWLCGSGLRCPKHTPAELDGQQ